MLMIKICNGQIIETEIKNFKNALSFAKCVLEEEGIEETLNNKNFINSIGREKYFRNKNLIAYLK